MNKIDNYKEMADYIDTKFNTLYARCKNYVLEIRNKKQMVDSFLLGIQFVPQIISDADFDAMYNLELFTDLINKVNDLRIIEKCNSVTELLNNVKEEISEEPFSIPEKTDATSYNELFTENFFYEGFKDKLKPKDENAINVFLQKEKNSLSAMSFDFLMKTDCLYRMIIQEKSFPEYIRKLSSDYFKLIDCIYNGYYIVDGRMVSLNDAVEYDKANPNFSNLEKAGIFKYIDFGESLDVSDTAGSLLSLFSTTVSSASMIIAYNYWRYQKDNESLKRVIKIMAIRTLLFTDFREKKDNLYLPNINDILYILNFDVISENSIDENIKLILSKINDLYLISDDVFELVRNKNIELLDSLPDNLKTFFMSKINFDEKYYFESRVYESSTSGIVPMYRLKQEDILQYGTKKELRINDFINILPYYFDSEYKDTNGISYGKFDNNESFKEFKDLFLEEVYINDKGVLNNLNNDMDFTPYINYFLKENSKFKFYCNFDIYGIHCGYLSLCSELLIFLNNIVYKSDCDLADYDKIELLIRDINQKVYGPKTNRIIKSLYSNVSLENLDNKDLKEEIELSQKFVYLVDDMLDNIETLDQMNEFSLRKIELFDDMIHFGINESFIIASERISKTIVDKLVFICKKRNDYNQMSISVDSKFSILKDKLISKMGFKDSCFEEEMEKVRSCLVTGEILYESFVKNGSNNQSLDYGSMALVYYKALESLVNYVIYKPYYQIYLSGRNPEKKESEIGFCGDSYSKMIYKRDGKFYYKDALEYGIIAYVFSRISNSKETIELFNYLTSFKFDILKTTNFFAEMSKTSSFRNSCAHPEKTNVSCIKTARAITFDYNDTDGDEITTKINELIFRLPEILL